MLFLVLFGDLDFANLVSDVVQALFLELAHEIELALQLGEEELFVDAIKLSLHAKTHERSHMHITLGNHDIFTANDTSSAQRCNLVQSMLLSP